MVATVRSELTALRVADLRGSDEPLDTLRTMLLRFPVAASSMQSAGCSVYGQCKVRAESARERHSPKTCGQSGTALGAAAAAAAVAASLGQ